MMVCSKSPALEGRCLFFKWSIPSGNGSLSVLPQPGTELLCPLHAGKAVVTWVMTTVSWDTEPQDEDGQKWDEIRIDGGCNEPA